MEFRQRLAERKAKSGALGWAVEAGIDLAERREGLGNILSRNAGAC